MPVQHQQVNEYLTCKKYKETYTPGFYDNYGRYIQGSVVTQEYRLIPNGCCRTLQVLYLINRRNINNLMLPRSYYTGYYNGGGYCNPTRPTLGALLGGGVTGMSQGNGYYWSVPVGAAIGGALFGCNRY
jgi:hypothetical protein